MNTQIVKDSWNFAWEGFKKNVKFFVILAIAMVVVFGGLDQISKTVPFVGLLSMALGVFATLGIIAISEAVYTNNKPEFEMFTKHTDKFWRMLGATILAGIIIFIPVMIIFVFGIVAGVGSVLSFASLQSGAFGIMGYAIIFILFAIVAMFYIIIKMTFYKYVIYEKDLGVVDSLKESWKMTDGKMGLIVLFMLSVLAINIVGAILFIIGLAVTIPMTILSSYFFYKHFTKGQMAEPVEEKKGEVVETPVSLV